MDTYCTRPGCPQPQNRFPDLDDAANLKTVQQKYCTSCGMPQILAGHYIPMRLLGQGGFGAAFLAIDRYTPSNRKCVVKQFQPSENLSPQALKLAQRLFEREAIALENLGNQHPQIPDLYAFFPLVAPGYRDRKPQQYFYIVQEYVEGEDLEKECQRQGKLSVSQMLEVLTAVLKVLQFVHENRSIHRDIKPSNIMRDRAGKLYLLDFGAVKEVSSTGQTNPSASTRIHSPGYAPPEQISGGQVYPCSDLYALAATCLVLVTGKRTDELFDNFNHRWHWRTDAPDVSDPVAQVLNWMLAAKPSDRPPSAQAVLDALQSAARATSPQTPIAPPPPPAGAGKASKPLRHQRQPFALLEVLGSAAFTGFEGVLFLIVLADLIPLLPVSVGMCGMAMGGLVYAQYRRIIEKIDLAILAALSVAIAALIHFSFNPIELGFLAAIILSALGAATAVATTSLFRLIYQLLSGSKAREG